MAKLTHSGLLILPYSLLPYSFNLTLSTLFIAAKASAPAAGQRRQAVSVQPKKLEGNGFIILEIVAAVHFKGGGVCAAGSSRAFLQFGQQQPAVSAIDCQNKLAGQWFGGIN